jgi:coatomer subunit beta
MSFPSFGKSALESAQNQLLTRDSEVVEKFPALRASIAAKLIATLPSIKSAKVYRGVFWILGEYAEEVADINSVFQQLRKVIGEVPILASEQRVADAANATEEPNGDADAAGKREGAKPKVLADGTYATESAYSTNKSNMPTKAASKPPLRG